MANTLNLGDGNWATKEDSLLGYNSENNNYKPLPFDFSRASSSTVVNKDGLIETVGGGEPRIDFKDNTKGALLLEPQRSNVLPYSEDFSQWDLVRATSTANSTISPDGKNNAYKIQSNANTTNGSWYREIISSFSGSYELSVFAKSGTTDFLQLRIDGVGGVVYDLSNGVVKSQENATGSVENYGNGWYRCKAQITASSSTVILMLVGNENMTPQSWATTNGNNIYLYGASLESGSYATSYIPTQGSAVTRLADSCTNSGNDQVINSTEGVLYAEIKGFISHDTIEPNRYITITNGTSNERVALLLGGNSNQLRAIIYSSTQSINLSFTTSLTDVKQYNKLAVKYKSGDYAFFLNGVKIDSSTITNDFSENTLNDLSFDVGGGTQQFRGIVKDLKLYNTALTDQELQALTSN